MRTRETRWNGQTQRDRIGRLLRRTSVAGSLACALVLGACTTSPTDSGGSVDDPLGDTMMPVDSEGNVDRAQLPEIVPVYGADGEIVRDAQGRELGIPLELMEQPSEDAEVVSGPGDGLAARSGDAGGDSESVIVHETDTEAVHEAYADQLVPLP